MSLDCSVGSITCGEPLFYSDCDLLVYILCGCGGELQRGVLGRDRGLNRAAQSVPSTSVEFRSEAGMNPK